MQVKSVEKFSSYLLTTERELAQEVTNSLLTKGSYVINFYFLFQLFLLSGNISLNHFIASFLLIITLFISIKLMNKFKNNSPLIINQIALLMLPIYVDNYVTNPWVSYGLLCAILVLFAAGLDNKSIFTAVLITAPLLQYFVANLNLVGVIDSKDILFLNSYFSSLWILIAGIGVRLARASYYKYCNQIDEQLFALQERMLEENKSQAQLNLKDYKNVSIHGTVLNTLISYNNVSNLNQKTSELANDLATDILKIESAQQSITTNTPFMKIINSNLNQYQIQLKLNINPNLILDSQILESTLEIIREVVLNTKKHTNSKVLEINVMDTPNELQITIREILEHSLNLAQMENKLLAAKSSKTLQRLTNTEEINITIRSNTNKSALIYDIKILKYSRPTDVLKRIEEIRNASLIKNIQLLSLVSVFYSYLAIVGFIIVSVPIYIILTLFFAAILLTYELLGSNKSTWRPLLSQIALMTLIPYVIYTNETCQNLLYTPWLFNAVLGSVLYGIAVLKNPILKWAPALIFIVENTRTRWTFPEECKTLLDGSTPGFVFILIFGFLMARLRMRNTSLDRNLESSLQSQIDQSKQVALLVDQKRHSLIEELKVFSKNVAASEMPEELLREKISRLIQKIRVFLICSEHFSSSLIQSLFEFATKRIEGGSPVRISIYASQLSEDYAFDFALLDQLNLESLGKSVDIVISENEKLELEYLVDGQAVATFNLTN